MELRCGAVRGTWTMFPAAAAKATDGSDSTEAQKKLKMIRDRCHCHRNEVMNQQWPKKETGTHGCLSKSCAQGWELSFSILSSEASLSFSEGHLFIGAAHFVSFLGLHPASCGSDHISGPQFNLPNVIMDQANQPPGRLWGLAKHYQLWHT